MRPAKFRLSENWKSNRYAYFNKKIDAFSSHPKYSWLRKYADKAILWNENYELLQNKGESFIERIEKADISDIENWLNGKGLLK